MDNFHLFVDALSALQATMAKFDTMRAETTEEQWQAMQDIPCVSDFIDTIVELEHILEQF